MVKFGMTLAGLLTGVLLKVSGFDVVLKTNQSDQTLFLLRVFDVGIPTFTSFLALIIIAKYSLSETRMLEIRDLLEKRRGKL